MAENLILDTSPFLASSSTSLRRLISISSPTSRPNAAPTSLYTTPSVLREITDSTSLSHLTLLGFPSPLPSPLPSSFALLAGAATLFIRRPSAKAMERVRLMAKATGDLSVLSETDLEVAALAVEREVEVNGERFLREKLGGKTGKEREKEEERRRKKENDAEEEVAGVKEEEVVLPQEEPVPEEKKVEAEVEPTEKTEQPQVFSYASAARSNAAASIISTPPSTSAAPATASGIDNLHSLADSLPSSSQPVDTTSSSDDDAEALQDDAAEFSDEASDDDETSSTSSAGSWITPSNVASHKARDLAGVSASAETAPGTGSSSIGVACVTGDFAVQNVLLQIGVRVLGGNGERVKSVRTWILRCHACFRLCKDPLKKFCPSCGGPTLMRTSITYTPTSPTGYILHLKRNFQYHNRGNIFPLPSPKPGSTSAIKNGDRALVLREDQKEFVRGAKSAEVKRKKEEKRARNGDGQEWEAFKVGKEEKEGRGEIRWGKDGMPLVGWGKGNPNDKRRRRK